MWGCRVLIMWGCRNYFSGRFIYSIYLGFGGYFSVVISIFIEFFFIFGLVKYGVVVDEIIFSIRGNFFLCDCDCFYVNVFYFVYRIY